MGHWAGGHILEIKSKRVTEVNIIKSKKEDNIHAVTKLKQSYHETREGKKYSHWN